MKYFPLLFLFLFSFAAHAQEPADTSLQVGKKTITLSEVVADSKLNIPAFIEKIKNDSSFYKAFKNLHIVGYRAINDIRMTDKKGKLNASLFSKTRQLRKGSCRYMETLEENTTGDIYDANGNFNYYTGRLFASLFFTTDTICNENNIVKGTEFSTKGKSGMEKHKEQLKMLFFNPGKKINGLPFISNKTAIYDDDMADAYDMDIDLDVYNGVNCYIFHQKVKDNKKGKVVVDEMTTWFNQDNMEVVARTYSLSYDAGLYDFDVQMEVQMTTFKGLTIPALVRYTGNWKAITQKRERGFFTVTLSDFE